MFFIDKNVNVFTSFCKNKSLLIIKIFLFIFFYHIFAFYRNINNKNSYNKFKTQINKLVEENFFIIDSKNLETINPHMYGYIISKKGILTDNYFKMIGRYEEPEPLGVYIMIRKNENEIIINQDYYGSIGLYYYENKMIGYFALSNSFLYLVEYLIHTQNLTLNKDFSDNFIITELTTFAIYETMIKEIIQLPSNALIKINIKKRIINISYINRQERKIPLESEKGFKIIDKWFDKWVYILKSLKRKTNNISFDLSGGYDSRLTFSILLKSGININEILINSRNDKYHIYDEDFKIASNISSFFGFKLNNIKFDENITIWNTNYSLDSIIYTKLGFNKNINSIQSGFYNKPRFLFNGGGGENIRGKPGYKIKEYLEMLTSTAKQIKGHQEELYIASMRLYNRSIEFIKKENISNDYEIAQRLYQNSINRYHFGKGYSLAFMSNMYCISPLMDPELRQIKYDISENSKQDIIAYIYTRFAPKLIIFPFDKHRIINFQSLQKANNLNRHIPKYKIQSDYNGNYFIDIDRKTPVPQSLKIQNDKSNYISEVLNSSKYRNILNNLYDNNIYNWTIEFSHNTNHIPLRHQFGLFAIAKIIKYIS